MISSGLKYFRTLEKRDSHTKIVMNWDDFQSFLDQKFILLSPFCGRIECEDEIKKESMKEEKSDPRAPAMGAKALCIPFEQVILIILLKICVIGNAYFLTHTINGAVSV